MVRLISFTILILCLSLSFSPVAAQDDPSLLDFQEPITLENADQVELLATLTPIGRAGDFVWTKEGYVIHQTNGQMYQVPVDLYAEQALNLASASAISSNLPMLAFGGSGGRVFILDLFNATQLATFQCGNWNSTITSLAFSSDEKRIAAGNDKGAVCIWEWDSNIPLVQTQIQTTSSPIAALFFNPKSDVLIINAGWTSLFFWRFEIDDNAQRSQSTIWPQGVEFNQEQTQFLVFGGQQLGASSAGLIRVYDAESYEEIAVFGEIDPLPPYDLEDIIYRLPVQEAHFNPDGTTLTGVSPDSLYIWNLSIGSSLASSPTSVTSQEIRGISDTAFDLSRTKVAFIDPNNSVSVWNTNTGQQLAIRSFNKTIRTLVFHPNSTLLALETEDGLLLWDTTTYHTASLGQPFDTLLHLTHPIIFNPTGTLLMSCSDAYFTYHYPSPPIYVWGVPYERN